MNNKRAGVYYETCFVTEAMKQGFDVFSPIGDHLPQDFILQNKLGKLFRVQVKGTWNKTTHEKRKTPRYKIIAASGSSGKIPIDCNKVDVLAAFIAEHDTWYLIPCQELRNNLSLWFYPDAVKTKARLEKFKEAWSIFLM